MTRTRKYCKVGEMAGKKKKKKSNRSAWMLATYSTVPVCVCVCVCVCAWVHILTFPVCISVFCHSDNSVYACLRGEGRRNRRRQMGLRGVEDIKCVASVCAGVCVLITRARVCAGVRGCTDDLWCGGGGTVCVTQIAGFMLSTRLQMVTGEASASLRTPPLHDSLSVCSHPISPTRSSFFFQPLLCIFALLCHPLTMIQ